MSPRYFVSVSDSEDNMVEEEHYLRKTTRGMKAAKKRVPQTKPKAPPVQVTSEEASQSRSKGKKKAQVRRAGDTPQKAPNLSNMDTHQFIDDIEHYALDPVDEEIQPQTKVCLYMLYCHSFTDDI